MTTVRLMEKSYCHSSKDCVEYSSGNAMNRIHLVMLERIHKSMES